MLVKEFVIIKYNFASLCGLETAQVSITCLFDNRYIIHYWIVQELFSVLTAALVTIFRYESKVGHRHKWVALGFC